MKTKKIPFDIELAKKIQSGEIEGRIVTNHGKVVTLVDASYGFNEEYWIPIIWHWSTEDNQLFLYNSKGERRNSHSDCYLHIELPEEAPKHKFKPFDKVLVRDSVDELWKPQLYDRFAKPLGLDENIHLCLDGEFHYYCIPYEGNEHLVGTTNNPE